MKVVTVNFIHAVNKSNYDTGSVYDPFSDARALSERNEEILLNDILNSEELNTAKSIAIAILGSCDAKFLGFCNRLIVEPVSNDALFTPSDENEYLYIFTGNQVHSNPLVNDENNLVYQPMYLPIVYEGDDLPPGFFDIASVYAINKITAKSDLFTVSYGAGDASGAQLAKYRDMIYSAVSKIIARPYSSDNIYLIPFHPIEHFVKEETIHDAVAVYDKWVTRFHLLRELFNHISVKYFVIMGFAEWVSKPPDDAELQEYLDSHPMGDYFVQRSLINERRKETSDECIVTQIEGMSKDPVVTIVTWCQNNVPRNNELYYAVEGQPPLEAIKLFCKEHKILFQEDKRFLDDKVALKRLHSVIMPDTEN